MALTKIGSIGINTGIAFAGVTTITTLNGSDAVLSVGGTVNFNSDVSIGGSVSIGGTLTYEDVTNIDSVGLITARNGIVVGSGITLSVDGDGFFTGVVTATTFKGDGSQLSNVTSTTINNNADNRLITGSGTANTLEGEANLTYDGSHLSIATDASTEGIKITSTGNTYNELSFGANRTSATTHIGRIISNWNGTTVSYISFDTGSDTTNKDDGIIRFWTAADGNGNYERLRITSDGHVLPGANNTYDLGSSSSRWANLYTNDLQLSNEGKSNDVDGTWGNYTIQEGENDLFLINNRSGKKYKFNLTEIS